jgi:putative transposase
MRTRNPGRLRAFDYLGPHRYSLTFCTDRRQTLFTTHDVVDLVLEQIARAASEYQFEITAHCFMPDHLHLLIEGKSADSDAKQLIAHAKQYSGFYYKQARGSKLWQRYGFEHVLRDEELTLVVAKYILENPVPAGLVKRVEDYPFVGSLVYSLQDLLAAIAAMSG